MDRCNNYYSIHIMTINSDSITFDAMVQMGFQKKRVTLFKLRYVISQFLVVRYVDTNLCCEICCDDWEIISSHFVIWWLISTWGRILCRIQCACIDTWFKQCGIRTTCWFAACVVCLLIFFDTKKVCVNQQSR